IRRMSSRYRSGKSVRALSSPPAARTIDSRLTCDLVDIVVPTLERHAVGTQTLGNRRHCSPISSEWPKDPRPTHAPVGRRIPRAGRRGQGTRRTIAPMPRGAPTAPLIGRSPSRSPRRFPRPPLPLLLRLRENLAVFLGFFFQVGKLA